MVEAGREARQSAPGPELSAPSPGAFPPPTGLEPHGVRCAGPGASASVGDADQCGAIHLRRPHWTARAAAVSPPRTPRSCV